MNNLKRISVSTGVCWAVAFTVFCACTAASVVHGGELPDWIKPLPIEPEFLMAEGMVLVGGGCFQMGDTFGDGDEDETTFGYVDEDEKPAHEVCVDDFYMDTYEVTQEAYKDVMGDNPSEFKGNNRPVERVTWNNAKDYCNKVGKRLPTEAEWEYAAREGGKRVRFGTGKDTIGPDEANFVGSSIFKKSYSRVGVYREKTTTVGTFAPNGLGLYDMSGNVWEWVSDWYDDEYYKNSPRNNPRGPSSGTYRVLRGGSLNYGPRIARASNRYRIYPKIRPGNHGFRCARTTE